MHSYNSQPSIDELLNDDSLDQREYAELAGCLLRQLFAELQKQTMNDPEFARVLFVRGPDVIARLRTLESTVALLALAQEAQTVRILMCRATTLIAWLSDEIDQLTQCAFGHLIPFTMIPTAIH